MYVDVYGSVDRDYDEQRMRDSLHTAQITGRMTEVSKNIYGPLRNDKDMAEAAISNNTLPQLVENDGWISWTGGECPVDCGTVVDIKFPDGETVREKAEDLRWYHDSASGDIMAYRVVEKAVPNKEQARIHCNLQTPEERKIVEDILSGKRKWQFQNTEPHPLQKVFDEVITQVSKGKGEERHGQGKPFMEQPWYSLAETHGIGFLTGQAGKKLDECQSFDDQERWKKEMLGAIAYAAMAVLYDEIKKGSK